MRSRHILLVDDDPEIGVIVSVLARKAGHRLTRARDVGEARVELAREVPELVLLDVNLPGESGLELLREMRDPRMNPRNDKQEEMRGLPVALFCQSGLTRDVAAGWASGATYLFAKDLVSDPAAWSARLAEILAHADGQSRVASLQWSKEDLAAGVTSWQVALQQAGEEPRVRGLGTEVLEQVHRRCLVLVFGDDSPGLSRAVTAEQVRRLLPGYLDQIECLLGFEAGLACAARLRQALGNEQAS